MSRLKYAPEASAPGFQYTAEASSVTATEAPPMPAARVVTGSKPWAPAGVGVRSSVRMLNTAAAGPIRSILVIAAA